MSLQSSYPTEPSAGVFERSHSDERLSPRRPTLARVEVLEGPALEANALASNLSAVGAFIQSNRQFEVGERLRLSLSIPTLSSPIAVKARIARRTGNGFGVRFEEISARDRSKLISHTGFTEMDEKIVRLQERLGDLMPGNLLPLADREEILSILRIAGQNKCEATVVVERRGFSPILCHFDSITDRGSDPTGEPTLFLRGLEKDLAGDKVVHVVFSDGAIHYAFESLVLKSEGLLELTLPPRLYLNERRTNSRAVPPDAFCEFWSPSEPGGTLRTPVFDLAESGLSIELPAGTLVLIGSHLPGFTLEAAGYRRMMSGATVRYAQPMANGNLRIGLHLDHAGTARATFEDIQSHSLESDRFTRLRRGFSMVRGRLKGLLKRSTKGPREKVEVVRYRNRLGDTVAGIIDANFDTSDTSIRPDVAVIIAPALLKRKEVFALLARTIIDDLGRDGHKVVTIRFDFSHIVGESTMDPELVERGCPYLNWNLRHTTADIEASRVYLEKRFKPRKRVLTSFSFAAIAARQVVREAKDTPIDLWVSPFGCPDLQDMLRNYLAGLDLFPAYEKGEGPELVHIHGRPSRGANYYLKAIEDGLAYLDQARADIAKIQTPITWIIGTYDHWVTRSRVKAMLEAPGDGVREVFECATGHVLKEGPQAIEVFKLVSESISKHVFGNDRPASDPDLARFTAQTEAEWARVKRLKLGDAEQFWKEHLFGREDGEVGYDITLDHPDYPRFLERQSELLDPGPGQKIADFGCGTGNLLMSILRGYGDSNPSEILFADLVGEALERTEEKMQEFYANKGTALPAYEKKVVDLEISRLGAVRDFLNGRIYGVEGLVGRVDGLNASTARKLAGNYGKEVHEFLRGAQLSRARLLELCPQLNADEAEEVEELARAARFILGQLDTEDLMDGVFQAESTRDLRFSRLDFGKSSPTFELDIEAESLDRIGASLVLSYLSDPRIALQEFHRLLKPGGILVASSLLPNWDPSKLYAEEAALLSRDSDLEANRRKLDGLRAFANMLSLLIELEEDGRFQFFSPEEFRSLAAEAGFVNVHVFESLGNPASAIILRAEKMA